MHWFVCNDAKREIRGVDLGGSAWRAGRFYLYGASRPQIKASWHFFNSLNWLEAYLRFGGEDSTVTVGLILPWLAYLSVGFALPTRWLRWWMIEDRVFALKFGYIGDIVWAHLAYADWAESCGMTSYYRSQKPCKYTALQLWPGVEVKLKWPPLLAWILGKPNTSKSVLEMKAITFDLDGRRYDGTWTLERWETKRVRWPWPYRVRVSSNLEVPHPPQFAGKGENSWDCGDDGIYAMGSRETSPGKTIRRVHQGGA